MRGPALARTVDKLMLTDAPLMYSPETGTRGIPCGGSRARRRRVGAVRREREGGKGGRRRGREPRRSLDALDEIVRVGGDEPKEEVVRNIDKKLKTWRTSNPTSKGGDGEAKEGREGSDTRARAKRRETRRRGGR